MSRNELRDALQRETERRMAELRAGAVRQQAALRREAEERCQAARAEREAAWAEAAAAVQRQQRAAGRRAVQEVVTTAEARLAERMERIADSLLPQFAADCTECWTSLRDELPPLPWERLAVAERDAAAARRDFPALALDIAPGISGGMIATCSGTICDNTLEKRLQRAWEDLLPALFATIRQELGHDSPVAPE